MILWQLLCGVMAGIALTACVLVLRLRWKRRAGVRKGRRGERMVERELRRLRKKDTVILNDVLLPSSRDKTTQIDHIVISTRGVFVIETKSLSGRIAGTEHGQYWTRHFPSQSQQFYNPILQNRSHIRALRKLLPSVDDSAIVSMVVFTEAWRLDVKADDIVEPRRFFRDRTVRRTFNPAERRKRHWWCPSKEVRLDEGNIVARLDMLVPEILRRKKILLRSELTEIEEKIRESEIVDSQAIGRHVALAREASVTQASSIAQRICPRCGGNLVVRKTERGEFVGCVNYPSCRFTCSIDRLHTS